MRRYIPIFLSLLTLSISSVLSGPTPPPYRTQIERYDGEKTGRYIVTLKEGASRADLINQLTGVAKNAVKVDYEYDNVFNGFAATLDELALTLLQTLPNVESICEDGIMHTMAAVTQTNAPWGLARLSSVPRLAVQDPTRLDFQYTFDTSGGAGVDIYVIDTGVRVSHAEFGGRAQWAAVFGPYQRMDGNGHGTHVAATAAGFRFGVAKGATIKAVKVLSDQGSGSFADIVAGMNFVLAQCRMNGKPCVVNMSLGGAKNTPTDMATQALVASGVHVVVAAGNSNEDASGTSPASVPQAITVGASTIADSRASFSNFGSVVDLFAPGQNITSAWIESDTATKSISGTSMASPHVAGLVAYLISLRGNLSPAAMENQLKTLALKGFLRGLPAGTANFLAHNTF